MNVSVVMFPDVQTTSRFKIKLVGLLLAFTSPTTYVARRFPSLSISAKFTSSVVVNEIPDEEASIVF